MMAGREIIVGKDVKGCGCVLSEGAIMTSVWWYGRNGQIFRVRISCIVMENRHREEETGQITNHLTAAFDYFISESLHCFPIKFGSLHGRGQDVISVQSLSNIILI